MIHTHIIDSVYWIGLNNPGRKNALSKEGITQLTQTFERLKTNDTCRVVVLYGLNDCFCSGADLEWMRAAKNQDESLNLSDAALFYTLYQTLFDFPKPIVTWVQKVAYGGALGLLAVSDLVVADKEAVFAFSEVKLGLVPATIAPFVLKKVGLGATQALMLTGEVFSAKKAQKIGLVSEVLKSIKSKDKVVFISELLSKNGPKALQATKQLLHVIVEKEENKNQLQSICCQAIANARTSEEGQEGLNAFFDKRLPSWIPTK